MTCLNEQVSIATVMYLYTEAFYQHDIVTTDWRNNCFQMLQSFYLVRLVLGIITVTFTVQCCITHCGAADKWPTKGVLIFAGKDLRVCHAQ